MFVNNSAYAVLAGQKLSNLQFRNERVSVSLKEFQQTIAVASSSEHSYYSSNNHDFIGHATLKSTYLLDSWVLRKVRAIPMAVVGIVKTIYHLFMAILSTPWLASDSDYFTARCFMIVRDLEEIVGRLVTIFHDTLGTYMVEEALFYKDDYQRVLNNKTFGAIQLY